MTEGRPVFSVVVPVHNRAARILPTLESVQAQSFTDFECIVVDDGSDDGAALRAVVEGMRDTRFRYLRRPNGGGGAARNTGIEAAKGAYIAFLDSDDAWLPGKLAADHEAIEPGTVLFSPVAVRRNGRMVGTRPARGPRPGEPISEYLAVHQGFTQTSTLVVPGDIRSRFSEQARFGQDTDIALRLAAEGLAFKMHAEPLVVMDDTEAEGRVSRSRDWHPVETWLEEVRGLMTERAYWAYRGWHVARIAAQRGEFGVALRLYLQSLLRGAFPPKLAAKALAQILVPRRVYRLLDRIRPGER